MVRRNFVNGVDSSGGYTQPTVRTVDADLQSLRTLPGYDTLTGLGAPGGRGSSRPGDPLSPISLSDQSEVHTPP